MTSAQLKREECFQWTSRKKVCWEKWLVKFCRWFDPMTTGQKCRISARCRSGVRTLYWYPPKLGLHDVLVLSGVTRTWWSWPFQPLLRTTSSKKGPTREISLSGLSNAAPKCSSNNTPERCQAKLTMPQLADTRSDKGKTQIVNASRAKKIVQDKYLLLWISC